MRKILSKPVHFFVDLENIEISISNLEGNLILKKLDELINDIVRMHNIEKYQVHVFMPLSENPKDWEYRKRDAFQYKGYNVVTENKSFNGKYQKADLDAAMGTSIGIACTLGAKQIWLLTGDGDFKTSITILKNQFSDLIINLGCVTNTTKDKLFKSVRNIYTIHEETPGIESRY